MNTTNYLEMLPLNSITKYASGHPNDGVPFAGYPRAHPSDKLKFVLVNDPLGAEPIILEFKLEDILYMDEVPSAITEEGEGVPLVKLWIKHGAMGVILEPFEVNEPVKFVDKIKTAKERLLQHQHRQNAARVNL
ncbi:MAG: hypothetical protein FWB83_04460 [Treponema sp.]|nr:hypothetical protein [Treponema sp.]